MKKVLLLPVLLVQFHSVFGWGFFGHGKINYLAVFLLPPQMLLYYKKHIGFISDHATDPDKRRYAVKEEAPRHYIDIDQYGSFPYDSLPRKWEEAVKRFTEDSLQKHGIVPWWIQVMYRRLVQAFRNKDGTRILRLSAEIGHYLADAHVPLHASSNHNGQFTGQRGIHGFWESRIPELLAEKEWDFLIGKAAYIEDPLEFTWRRVLESAAAVDSVLRIERELTARFSTDQKYSYESRNGIIVRQYSSAFSIAYDRQLHGMIERRMRQSVFAVASFWYSAWVDAGQPDLSKLHDPAFTEDEKKELELLDQYWKNRTIIGREE